MNNSLYVIRNYRPADFDNCLQLVIEAERTDPVGRYTSPGLLHQYLRRPSYSSEEDLFLAETNDDLIGFIDVTPELKIGRAILDFFIRPEHLQKELAEKLFAHATHRAQKLGAQVVQICIPKANIAFGELLSKLGFEVIRCFKQLRLSLDDVPKPELSSGLSLDHLKPDEESKLADLQNRAFAGHWGYSPNTTEEITYLTRMSNCPREGIFLAYEGAKPVGYCWTKMDCPPGHRRSQGQIFMLGVDPSYRGRKIGKALLLTGLYYLKSQGLNLAQITVDSENKVARSLYRSAGFKPFKNYLWYEKTTA